MRSYQKNVVAVALGAILFSAHVAADPSAPGTVSCSNPFGRDSTRLDLVRAFGRANVVDQDVEGHGGGGWQGTVIYPNDPERRLEVLWGDEIHRRLLASVLIRERSRWKGWREVHIGMSLKEVEALNEKPFKLTTDFNTDDSDTVTQWQGGAMERVPGGCQVFVRFQPADDAPSDVIDDLVDEHVSSEPKVRSLRLSVSEIYTSYSK